MLFGMEYELATASHRDRLDRAERNRRLHLIESPSSPAPKKGTRQFRLGDKSTPKSALPTQASNLERRLNP